MQGYQFAHIDIWSRQGGAVRDGAKAAHRMNGQRTWTVAQILDEAERAPHACDHVAHPRPPVIIPGSYADFNALRIAHDAACAVRQSFPYTNPKTGKKSTRRRALRKDSPSLYSAVFSLPITPKEALADPARMAECEAIFEGCIAFERARIEDAGGEVALSVIHLDEAQVHLHLYALDRGRGTVKALHPGHAALADAGLERGASRERATRRYCDAMRGWQNDLHREVMGPAGLLRFGPGRERLSRAEYQRRKQAQAEAARAQEVIADSLALAGAVRAAGDALREREGLLEAQDIAQEEAAFDLVDREAELCWRESAIATEREFLARREQAHAAKVQADEAARKRREMALDLREAEAAERIRREEHRATEAAARAEHHRDRLARKEHAAEAERAAVEAVMEGFMVPAPEGAASPLMMGEKTRAQPSRWQALRARWAGAADAASRAMLWVAELRRQVLRETREELLRDYGRLGGVLRIAEGLIQRLPVAERALAREELERAKKGEILDALVLRQGDTPRLRPRREPQR